MQGTRLRAGHASAPELLDQLRLCPFSGPSCRQEAGLAMGLREVLFLAGVFKLPLDCAGSTFSGAELQLLRHFSGSGRPAAAFVLGPKLGQRGAQWLVLIG